MILLFTTIGILTYSQEKLSPKFSLVDRRIDGSKETTFSLSVKNIEGFKTDFPEIAIKSYSDIFKIVLAQATLDQAFGFAQSENIIFVDFHELPKEESYLSHPNFEMNRVRKVQENYNTIKGEYIHISIKERSIDTTDIDVLNRIQNIGLELDAFSSHATDIATIVGGAGNSDEFNIGVIPHCIFSSSGFDNLFPDDPNVLKAKNIQIQNHSYGVGIENYYGNEALAYDISIYNHPNQVHVFSSGNFGSQSPETGIYLNLPVANLSGTFKQAKNVLVINAFDSLYQISGFNSTGPAYDGRLKPELSAYGNNGTSDAAAITSGVVGFMKQAYLNSYGTFLSSDLIKAILISGSDDIGKQGIDFKTGYGSVNAKHSMSIIDSNYFAKTNLKVGQDTIITIEIPNHTKWMKVAIVWNDPPAPINSDKALINDVDAKIRIAEDEYLPWVLSSYPHIDSLNMPAKRRADHLNNVEFFTVEDPAFNQFNIELNGQNLLENQIVTWAYFFQRDNYFEWDNPVAYTKCNGGETVQLLWEQTLEKTGNLFYKTGTQEDWIGIENNIDLTEPYFWKAPNLIATAQLRMEIIDDHFDSPPFFISPKSKVNVSYNCPDESGLIWDDIAGRNSYEIFALGDQYMELLGATNDTSFAVNRNIYGKYYSVRPIFDDGVGLRYKTINIDFLGALCFVNFFGVTRIDQETIEMRLDLSTIHDVIKVEFIKIYFGETETFKTEIPRSDSSIKVYDVNFKTGLNIYNANIYLKDGTVISSDPVEIYIEKVGEAVLFPNPIHGESYLNILSEGNVIIEILDSKGKSLFTKELLYTVDLIDIGALKNGVYYFRLYQENKTVDSGKFVKY